MGFNFELRHKPGKVNFVADPLSRRADHEEGVELDNRDQILLKPEFFAISAIESSHEAPINDDQLLREVKEALLDDDVTKDYRHLLKSGPREFTKSLQEWNYENRLLLYRGKVYIPKSEQDHLRRRIVQIYHDLPSVQYTATLFQECGKLLGIESTMSTAYHAQTVRLKESTRFWSNTSDATLTTNKTTGHGYSAQQSSRIITLLTKAQRKLHSSWSMVETQGLALRSRRNFTAQT